MINIEEKIPVLNVLIFSVVKASTLRPHISIRRDTVGLTEGAGKVVSLNTTYIPAENFLMNHE
jgi:hypothetical protein